MRNWYSHTIVGFIVAIAFVILAREYSPVDLAAATLAIVFGSILPDIDHPSAKIRQAFRYLVFGAILLLAYFVLYATAGAPLLTLELSTLFLLAPVFALSFIVTHLIERTIPPHRGPFHRIQSAVLYGALCALASMLVAVPSPLLVGLAGIIGYLTHLLTDKF